MTQNLLAKIDSKEESYSLPSFLCLFFLISLSCEEAGERERRRVAPERHKNRPGDARRQYAKACAGCLRRGRGGRCIRASPPPPSSRACWSALRRRSRWDGRHGLAGEPLQQPMTALIFFFARHTSWLDCLLDASSADLSAFLVFASPPKPACAQLCGEAEAACLWTRS